MDRKRKTLVMVSRGFVSWILYFLWFVMKMFPSVSQMILADIKMAAVVVFVVVVVVVVVCHSRRLRMVLRSARLACESPLSSPKKKPNWRWYRADWNAGHHSHRCSADSFFSPQRWHRLSSLFPVRCCHLRKAGW